MRRRFVVTGPPGGGKTPLIAELVTRGFVGVPEPARGVIAEAGVVDGLKIYDRDPQLFVDLMLQCAVRDFDDHADADAHVFFDRGLPDHVCYPRLFGLDTSRAEAAARARRYDDVVLFLPSWPEIYVTDEDRRMSLEQAAAFGDDIRKVCEDLGYTIVDVPHASVAERADFVMRVLDLSTQGHLT